MEVRTLVILLLLTGCRQENVANRAAAPATPPATRAQPPPTRAQPPPANSVDLQEENNAEPDRADLAGLSPSQRRAYQRGYADCRAGRYDPERGPEAYRIGCAAAHDR